MTVSAIMEKFGGLSAFAQAMGVPTSTAHSWKTEDYIPAWRQAKVLELALELGEQLSTGDFPTVPARKRVAA